MIIVKRLKDLKVPGTQLQFVWVRKDGKIPLSGRKTLVTDTRQLMPSVGKDQILPIFGLNISGTRW